MLTSPKCSAVDTGLHLQRGTIERAVDEARLALLVPQDPTTLFAGIARQARQRLGIPARQAHVDTTSFAVAGEYDTDLDAHTLAVTYGYSRDHRMDLK